jgi:hypothetical protein
MSVMPHFFGANRSTHPRRYNRIQIVLREGRIYLRKSLISGCHSHKVDAVLHRLRWNFYIEAAALLRLRGLNGVPPIRRIEARNGAIEMDCIWGRDLRQILSAGRKITDEEIYNEEIYCSFVSLLASDSEISGQFSTLLSDVVERGHLQGRKAGELHHCGTFAHTLYRRFPRCTHKEQGKLT